MVKQFSRICPDVPLFLVMDRVQFDAEIKFYSKEIFNKCEIIKIPFPDLQIGYARSLIMNHAERLDFDYILMMDDDSEISENIETIFDNFKNNEQCAWIGMYSSFFGIDGIKANTGVQFTCSFCFCAMALDVKKVMEVGNYDPDFVIREDQDLLIRLLQNGYYAGVDTGIKIKFLEKQKSGNGGCSSHDYETNDTEVLERFTKKYGRYFFVRKEKCVVQWRKMYRHGMFKVDFDKAENYRRNKK